LIDHRQPLAGQTWSPRTAAETSAALEGATYFKSNIRTVIVVTTCIFDALHFVFLLDLCLLPGQFQRPKSLQVRYLSNFAVTGNLATGTCKLRVAQLSKAGSPGTNMFIVKRPALPICIPLL
jgi:hypothetical protein